MLQQSHEISALLWHCCGGVTGEPPDVCKFECISLLIRLTNAKTFFAQSSNPEQPILEPLEIHDACRGTDIDGVRLTACLDSFANQRDAEARVLAHTSADHVHVARFENAQLERPFREKHCVQRKQWNGIHAGADQRSSVAAQSLITAHAP